MTEIKPCLRSVANDGFRFLVNTLIHQNIHLACLDICRTFGMCYMNWYGVESYKSKIYTGHPVVWLNDFENI